MYSQYLECREEELNELHHLLDTNHKAVTKWKTDVAATAKVNSIFVGGVEKKQKPWHVIASIMPFVLSPFQYFKTNHDQQISHFPLLTWVEGTLKSGKLDAKHDKYLCVCVYGLVGQVHALWRYPRPGGASGHQHLHELVEGWPGGRHAGRAQTM